MVNPSFWRGRRVWLSGHTGFKGAWLSLWLNQLEADISALALAPEPEPPSLFELAELAQLEHLHSQFGDIRQLERVQQHMTQAQPEVVLHLAAQALVRPSYQQPVETYATNIMGTVHVLEAVRHCPSVRAVVVVTSDKCYAPMPYAHAHIETDPMGGPDPYSSSKGAAELVVEAYRRSFLAAIGIATVRAGNVIGGGDNARDRLLPDLIRCAIEQRSAQLRYPHATRPWQHVLEPLSGYLALAEQLWTHGPDYSGGWNFGPQAAANVSVAQVADWFCQLWPGAQWHSDHAAHLHEAQLLALDSSKAQQALGWRSRWSAHQALSAVVSWQQQQLAGRSARSLCLEQIKQWSEGSGEKPL